MKIEMSNKNRRILTKFEDISKIAREIGKIKSVKAVYLFGSYAKNEQGPLSDTDLCIIGDLTKKEKYKALKLVSDNLDIVFFDMLPAYIKIRVFREGKVIFVRNKEQIRRLALKTLSEYLNFKPAINKFCWETLKCTT